jgi:hypothetical protein
MSYDNGQVITYTFMGVDGLGHDFGGANVATEIDCPLSGVDTTTPGVSVRGLVLGVTIFELGEVFRGDSANAGVSVGDGSDPDLYFDSGLVLTPTNPALLGSIYLLHDGGSGTTRREIPANLTTPTITVTFTAFTGTPTGKANTSIHIWWELEKKL